MSNRTISKYPEKELWKKGSVSKESFLKWQSGTKNFQSSVTIIAKLRSIDS